MTQKKSSLYVASICLNVCIENLEELVVAYGEDFCLSSVYKMHERLAALGLPDAALEIRGWMIFIRLAKAWLDYFGDTNSEDAVALLVEATLESDAIACQAVRAYLRIQTNYLREVPIGPNPLAIAAGGIVK